MKGAANYSTRILPEEKGSLQVCIQVYVERESCVDGSGRLYFVCGLYWISQTVEWSDQSLLK